MIWANPWAWIGVAAIAVPILVHLLARHTATAIPFPTLRFLRTSQSVDVKRRRLTDLPLLAIRVLIVAIAVAALAQPFWRASSSARINRVVIVDASESVAIDEARRIAAAQAEGTASFVTIERRVLRAAVAEAAGWLAARDGAGAIAIVSDFQRGALDAADVAGAPAGIGVQLHRVAMRAPSAIELAGVARWSIDDARSHVAWGSASASYAGLTLHGVDSRVAAAMLDAAAATADASRVPVRAATFVMPGSPNRDALRGASAPANAPWMFDMFSALGAAAESIRVSSDRVIVFLATEDIAEAAEAVRRAVPHLSNGDAVDELERATLSDAHLRALEREPAPSAPAAQPTAWAGRWFWIAVLLLLAVEGVARRARVAAEPEAHAHAA